MNAAEFWGPAIESTLAARFHHKSLRPGQKRAVEALLLQRDCLVVLPTGAGKSLCYQLPTLIRRQKGLGPAVVVSPLIALMNDQVRHLTDRGIAAIALHSGMAWSAQKTALLNASQVDFIYCSPERLAVARFRKQLQALNPSLFAIDEAHCMAQWGHDFRPAYGKLKSLREEFEAPIVALTATATPAVQREIIAGLGLVDPEIIIGDLRRPNLAFHVEHFAGDKIRVERLAELITAMAGENQGGKALVYVATRKKAKGIADALKAHGIRASHYHGGRTDLARSRAQAQFEGGKRQVMVATNAFGMGIDQPDIRLVVHMQLPGSLEAYYQEAGRAGRDGAPAQCHILFSDGDLLVQRHLLAGKKWPGAERAFDALIGYIHSLKCRQTYISSYFDACVQGDCGRCDSCLTPENLQLSLANLHHRREERAQKREAKAARDATYRLSDLERRQIIDFVDHLKKPVSKTFVAKGLKGSRAKTVLRKKLDENPHYGALRSAPEKNLVVAIETLLAEGKLAAKGKKYPTVWMPNKRVRPKTTRAKTPQSPPSDLKAALKRYRKREARRRKWKAYQVFSNQTLDAIVAAKPGQISELQSLPGMGPKRVERYGLSILSLVAQSMAASES